MDSVAHILNDYSISPLIINIIISISILGILSGLILILLN